MPETLPPLRIGLYGVDEVETQTSRGCGLWPVGNAASITAAGGEPQRLSVPRGGAWEDVLEPLDGVVFADLSPGDPRRQAEEERLCETCRELRLPFLGIDHGLHVLNSTGGGTLYNDLPRELPQALQHRHPPEEGLRHAINVTPGTRLARFYGEGEVVVNSLHRRAVARVARGLVVSGRALDGVVEALETEGDGWYAMGVQWHPASGTASGLDIQLFRGFLDVCRERRRAPIRVKARAA